MISVDYIFIELSNICNFSCIFCPYGQMTREKGSMGLEEVYELVDEIIEKEFQYKDVTFSILGEPLLYPGLLNILRYGEKKGLKINLNTNASLLNLQLFIDILKVGIQRFVFSIQTPDKKRFHYRNPGKISYFEYMHNIEQCIFKYVEYFNENRMPDTLIELHYMDTSKYKPNCSLVNSNEEAFIILKEWINRMKESFQLAKIDSNYEIRHFEKRPIDKLLDQEYSEGGFAKLLPKLWLRFRRATSWGNSIGNGMQDQSQNSELPTCDIASKQIAVLWNGDLVSCCLDYNGFNKLGNVWEYGSIERAWNSRKAKKFRDDLLTGKIQSHFCRVCKGLTK